MGDIYYDDQMNIDDLNGSESDLKHDPDQLDSTSKWISFFTSNGDTSDGCRDLTPGSSEFSRNDDISAAESDGTGDVITFIWKFKDCLKLDQTLASIFFAREWESSKTLSFFRSS